MPASLLEVLRTIPDRRRDEGKRFDLATVLLYAILSMVAGANSYRQMHEFIRIHLQRLNEAFGLRLRCSPSYTGLRLIIQGVDPTALEAAFRQHALSISTPPPSIGLTAIAIDGKTLRGSFDAFSDRKATHMMSALRQADQIVLGHLMVDEKSNEIPAAPELIEALGLKGCVFTLDAEHAQKNVRARDRLGQSSAHPGSRTTNRACAVSLNWEPQDESQPVRTRARPWAATAGKPAN